MKAATISLLFIVTFLTILKGTTQAKTPIIGIVSFYSEGWEGHERNDWNYFATSYVKWLKGAGAKVVPIQWDLPYDQMDYLLDRLNGVVFTGGNIKVIYTTGAPTPIFNAFKHITDYVLKKNQAGHYYPLWGTCMGFWSIARSLANNMSILTPCKDCVYVKRNVDVSTSYKSKMLRNLPQDLTKKIETDYLSVFLHRNMITPSVFQKNPRLKQYLTPVAYSYDVSGKKYVSMAESSRYPIYATQYHPEKPEFELKPNYDIPHTKDAIRFSQHLANFFVGEARKNSNVFSNSKKYLIENFTPTAVPKSEYMEVYFFPAYKPPVQKSEAEVQAEDGQKRSLRSGKN